MARSSKQQFAASDWIAKANADLEVAQELLAGGTVHFYAVAFFAQQSAEKYVKAFLVLHGVEFPKTHDLRELLALIHEVDPSLSSNLTGLEELNVMAAESRYPSDAPAVSDREARVAVQLAIVAQANIAHLVRRD